jgi:hypothetical protein
LFGVTQASPVSASVILAADASRLPAMLVPRASPVGCVDAHSRTGLSV